MADRDKARYLGATIEVCRQQINKDKMALDQLAANPSLLGHELTALKAREAKLIKELKQWRADISSLQGKISDLPNAVEEQRLKLNAFFKHLVSLIKTVRDIPGSIEQDQRDIDEIDHIHLHAINAIQNFLGL